MAPTRKLAPLALLVLALAGCPDTTEPAPDTGQPDVTVDASPDGDATTTPDAPDDAGPDGADATPDADAVADAQGDADAAPDAAPDTEDVPAELPPDVPDAVEDTVPDATPEVPAGDPPAVGDLIISELMVNPVDVSDLAGEWIELRNLSGKTLDLSDCVLTDDDGESAALSAGTGSTALVGDYYVIARLPNASDTGGVDPDLALPQFTLSNAADEVIITCGGMELDAVRYADQGDNPFPLVAGRALSFDAASTQSAGGNDSGSAWCASDVAYSGANFGTPGAANGECPDAPEGLDGCRLAAPVDVSFVEGGNTVLVAEIYEGGVTDKTPFVDPFPTLTVEVGWGPAGSDPSVDDTGWTWLTAPAAVGWSNAAMDGYDRYEVTVSPPAVGNYAAAVRASVGTTAPVFCDTDGLANGFEALGSFTSVDNPCEPNPCDAPPAATCVDDLVVGYEALGTCAVGDDFVAECEYVLAYEDCTETLASCAAGACVGAPAQPDVGDAVFSEIMIQPLADGDPAGEWFEVANVTNQDLNLAGCVVRDLEGESHVVAGPLLYLPAGERVVMARGSIDLGAGQAPDYVYGDALTLDNDTDELQLQCGDATVDSVVWDGAFLNAGDAPIGGPGGSVQLNPAATDAASNDDGTNWCASVDAYGAGDLGTPGSDNPACVSVVDVVKCRLQTPASLTIDATFPYTVTGRLRQPGLTDLTGGNDPAPEILAQAGWGPDGSDPSVDATGWVLVNAIPTDGYSDVAEPDLDQYEAVLVAPDTPGSYDIAFRFSVDGGASWTFCDLDAGTGQDGSEDGYQTAAAGELTVDPLDPCDPNPCTEPPADACTGNVLSTYATVGDCTADGQEFSCGYALTDIDCAALGGACDAGACTGLAAAPGPGEVVFTEIMLGEDAWVELLNLSGGPVNLQGCTLETASGGVGITDDLVLFADDRALFAASGEPGGVAPDLEWAGSDVGVLDPASVLTLSCGAAVDVVDLGAGGFAPPASGRSYTLDETAADASSNDVAANWCAAGTSLGGGLYGSPGTANVACPAVTPVDRCRLQSPETYVGFANDAIALVGRVWVTGVTDVTEGYDSNSDLLAEGGFGAQGQSPSAAWSWVSATPNSGWDAAGTGDEAYDEYDADVTVAGGGTFDAAFRFSADRGRTWTYCDRDTGLAGEDGSQDGYASVNAGTLALFDPCDPNPCTSAPANTCSGDVLTSYPDPGLCSNTGGTAICDYPPDTVDCAAKGGTCEVDQCNLPPAIAVGDVVVTEVMATSAATVWLELFNTSGGIRNLQGCSLTVDGAAFTVDTDVLIGADTYGVVSDASNGAFTSLWVVDGLSFDVLGASIELACGVPAVTIDTVTLTGAVPWPAFLEGRSIQLDASSLDATTNDDGSFWCTAGDGFGSDGEFGTPGAANASCD